MTHSDSPPLPPDASPPLPPDASPPMLPDASPPLLPDASPPLLPDASPPFRAPAPPPPSAPPVSSLSLTDFDFELPPELIAQHPLPDRAASRLLHVSAPAGALADRRFRDLPSLLRSGDLLVFNDTRVIKARFYGHKASGGAVEVLIERILTPTRALAMVRASKSPKPGSRLSLADAFECAVAGRDGEFFVLDLAAGADWWALAETHGRLPLPPYIEHAADASDEARYQTVFSAAPGAVAAPTAGLHFDAGLLRDLEQAGMNAAFVTLHEIGRAHV